jgi:hypothetical protein
MIPLPPPTAPDVALALYYFCAIFLIGLVVIEIGFALSKLFSTGNRRKHSKPAPEISAPDVYATRSGVYLAHWPNGQRYPTISPQANANDGASR